MISGTSKHLHTLTSTLSLRTRFLMIGAEFTSKPGALVGLCVVLVVVDLRG